MTVTIQPGAISGEISAIPSKSHLHRLLIFAALADKPTIISSRITGAEDIDATIRCLVALGATIQANAPQNNYEVSPIDRSHIKVEPVLLRCGESGSTLRFMLPVVCALGIHCAFEMKGRLPQRPLAPLDNQLESHDIRLWREPNAPEILKCIGKLANGEFSLPGDVSSQYISGLLMALPLMGESNKIVVSEPIESAGYISMTLDAMEAFSQKPEITKYANGITYHIKNGNFKSPGEIAAEGDWSNAAFWLCAGAMPGGNVRLCGVSQNSNQGDREVMEILSRMGAGVDYVSDAITVTEKARHATEIDARAIPDLIPVLAAVAAVAEGTTVVKNASRLRIKESDRLATATKTLAALGADIHETPDGLIIRGVKRLSGGTVDAHGDHRIAMTAAIAGSACDAPVTITGAEAVNKSYPQFWDDLKMLGKSIEFIG